MPIDRKVEGIVSRGIDQFVTDISDPATVGNAVTGILGTNVIDTSELGIPADGSGEGSVTPQGTTVPKAGTNFKNYRGPCPTVTTKGVDRRASDGSRCGRRAASIRPGGFYG